MARLRPIHPGEILREDFMAPLHLNPNKLALALHVPAPTIYDIVRNQKEATVKSQVRPLDESAWVSGSS